MAAANGKQWRSSGSSSDESDTAKDEGAGSTIGRSFECTYCKRGFTNAQALGGHMNIHRKDRAKAKKATATTKNANSYSDDPTTYTMKYRLIAPNMTTSTTDCGYGNWEAQRTTTISHHMYLPATTSWAPNLPVEPIRPGHGLGSNLSLGIGASASNNIEDDNHEDENNEDVDLELRLGPR